MSSDILNAYYDWYKDNFIINDSEIITPFIDSHNDLIHVNYRDTGERILLSDNGYTISNLLISGFSFTEGRNKIFETIVESSNIEIDSKDVVTMELQKNEFPQGFHIFVNALREIDNMTILAQQNVKGLFREDVERFFTDKNIKFHKNIRKVGKSGLDHYFDFQIGKSTNQKERIIRVLGSVDTKSVQSFLFSWNDINLGNETKMITILNDTIRKINPKVINAFRNYDVIPVTWNDRNNVVDFLSA
jgi:hypothetical protein